MGELQQPRNKNDPLFRRTMINSCNCGVPQGSILGLLLFNIFLCDMFLFCNDIDFASYADDNTPYCAGKTPEEVIIQLEKSSKSIFEWFENNGISVTYS